MSKIIAFANQKGGVGKTTTTVNLAAYLAKKGKKVLVIDMDSQGNTTSGFGQDKTDQENTVYELMLGDCSINEAIIKEVIKNVDLIPANANLAAIEIEMIGIEGKDYILNNSVEYVKEQYDFILMDCPPALNTATLNALTTANAVMITVQCEYLALEGLGELLKTISLVKERMNDKLKIDGILFTMYDSRTSLSMQVVENVTERLNGIYHIYETKIPRNVRLAEAPSFGMPICLYDDKSAGAEAYRKLAEEVLKRKDA
ncbi:MAG: ParA family protein [Lachnospiraceae bacterium]|nr:ParA family protein [Candidatus Merdinaster equi]